MIFPDFSKKSLDRVESEYYNIRAVDMILRLKSALNICFSRWDPISYAGEGRHNGDRPYPSCGMAKSTGQQNNMTGGKNHENYLHR